jgi:hypothetical protein
MYNKIFSHHVTCLEVEGVTHTNFCNDNNIFPPDRRHDERRSYYTYNSFVMTTIYFLQTGDMMRGTLKPV